MNIRSKIYWLWKKLSERKTRAHYREHYKAEIEYFEGYKDKKPSATMKREMNVLQKYWGCYPFQYIRYGMYKNSCTMSLDKMKDYVPNYFAYYLFFPKLNKCYGIVSQDKELSYRLFDSYGIAQPELLFQYKNGRFFNKAKSSVNDATINELINKSNANKLFFKPTIGLGGRGILVFNKKNSFVDKVGNELNARFIREQLLADENYILQEGLEQHEELSRIYTEAVNTFRIITKIYNGKAKLLLAMLRMGQGGSQIDNASQNGFVCKVDVDSGRFDSLGYSTLGKTLKKHPDSGFVFDGYAFPYWDKIKEFTLDATQKIETMGYIGWDIAFTVNGPAVIEMNAAPGLEYLQDCHEGIRQVFQIEKPLRYWYSNNYAIKDL